MFTFWNNLTLPLISFPVEHPKSKIASGDDVDDSLRPHARVIFSASLSIFQKPGLFHMVVGRLALIS